MRSSLFNSKAINQRLDPDVFGIKNNELNISVKRLDLINRFWGGNKYFKLLPNLSHAFENGYKGVLTFGGAYSNHIAATSAMATTMKLECIGIIRGERAAEMSITLQRAEKQGMKLKFISREQYRKRNDPEFIAELQKTYPEYYMIPEGGANAIGIQGCRQILDQNDNKYNHILVAGGTGGTACGIITSSRPSQLVTCIAVLNAGNSIETLIRNSVNDPACNWQVNDEYTFGGYAKSDPSLKRFIHDFTDRSGIPIEPVYTGKLFYGVMDMLRKQRFKKGENILIIHTGGLQYLDY